MQTSNSLLAALLPLAGALLGCSPTTHATLPSSLGVPRSAAALEAVIAEPGPVTVQTVVGADWEVPRSGVLNLDHPKARAAGLKDAPEPIQIVFHALRHPRRGLYLVDTGVERALVEDPEHAAINGLVATAAGVDKMKFRHLTATWLAQQPERLSGVFLTHLHLDHVSGMRDVPRGTPIYAGPGESVHSSFENFFVQPVLDAALEGQAPIQEWRFAPDPDHRFAGVLDVFGDRTVWALHVPGHTPGSTAYLVRTPTGPVLLAGDACHTAWGWEHGVEPGSFSDDRELSAASLARLEALVARHPEIDVRVGHQTGHVGPAAPERARPVQETAAAARAGARITQ